MTPILFRNQKWLFGQNAGLDFTAITPTSFFNSTIGSSEGSASISNPPSGALMLFSDGFKVWDGNSTLRASGLFGNQNSTQSSLFVPDPASKGNYYVFTADGLSGGNNHVNWGLINTSTWNWTAPPLSTAPTAGFSATERLTAIRHANGKDFWVLTVIQQGQPPPGWSISPGLLRVFLVKSTGVTWVGDQPLDQSFGDIGYLKASCQGDRLALVDMFGSKVLVYPFSKNTGQINLSGTKVIQAKNLNGTNAFPYGAEFSPNGRFLYYSTLFPLALAFSPISDGHIFQYSFVTSSSTLVGTHPNDAAGGYALGALQLGSWGKIYIAQDGETKLGVIASPDVPGTGCLLTFSALSLAPGSICRLGLPNMISSLF